MDVYVANQSIEIDPKTGWPKAFEAAVSLGHACHDFCVFVDEDGDVWCCLLVLKRGRAFGSGSNGKHKLRTTWRKLAKVKAGSDYIKTDWFFQDNRINRAKAAGCNIFKHDRIDDTVRILDVQDAPPTPT